jgi:hypothetical protein
MGTGGMGTGGMGTGGMGTGGMGTGGMATGGRGGGGGSGTGGMGGGAGGGAGGMAMPITISGSTGNFDNAFMLTPCTETGSNYDCGTATGACNATTQAYTQTYMVMGGTPNQIYDVTLRVQGLVEPKVYSGCTRTAGSTAPTLAGTPDMFCTGGTIVSSTYNVFELRIANTPAIPMNVTPMGGSAVSADIVRFNSHPSGTPANVFQVDKTFTIKVRPGTMLTLYQFDSNCRAIMNCGPQQSGYSTSNAACRAAGRTISGVTLPATYRGATHPGTSNGPNQPYQSQFVNVRVLSMTPAQ